MMQCAFGSFVIFSCLFVASYGAECFKTGKYGNIYYYGKTNVTMFGAPCMSWSDIRQNCNGNCGDSNVDENYCRVRNSEIGCYIEQPDGETWEWERCDIPECDAECFIRNTTGWPIYNGHENVTVSGFPCLRWDSNETNSIPEHLRNWYSNDSNYCRPSGTKIICYTKTTTNGVNSQTCNIPECGASNQTTIISTTPAIPEAAASSHPTSDVTTEQTSHKSDVGATTSTANPKTTAPINPLLTSGVSTEQTSPKSLVKTTTSVAIPEQTTPFVSPSTTSDVNTEQISQKSAAIPELTTASISPQLTSGVSTEQTSSKSRETTASPVIPESTPVSTNPLLTSGVTTERPSPKPRVERTTTPAIPELTTTYDGSLPTLDEQTSPKSLDKTTTTPVECATPVQNTMTNASVCLLSTSDLHDRQLYWFNFFNSNLSKAERDSILEKEKEAIRKELLLDTKLLTSYVRKKRCAEDNRYSAQAIGRVGIGFMVTIAVLIVLSDLISCFRRCH